MTPSAPIFCIPRSFAVERALLRTFRLLVVFISEPIASLGREEGDTVVLLAVLAVDDLIER